MSKSKRSVNWLKILTRDRLVLGMVIGLAVLSLAFVGYSILRIHPSTTDVQVIAEYNGFSAAKYSRRHWYEFYGWPILALIVGMVNGAIALKLAVKHQRAMALIMLSASMLNLVIILVFFNIVIGLPK